VSSRCLSFGRFRHSKDRPHDKSWSPLRVHQGFRDPNPSPPKYHSERLTGVILRSIKNSYLKPSLGEVVGCTQAAAPKRRETPRSRPGKVGIRLCSKWLGNWKNAKFLVLLRQSIAKAKPVGAGDNAKRCVYFQATMPPPRLFTWEVFLRASLPPVPTRQEKRT
jgi:hypothetical protein